VTSYFVLLAACWLVCMTAGGSYERMSASVVLANGIANETFVRMTGDATPWMWFLATDTLACLILTAPHNGRVKMPQSGTVGAVLAATYATQIVMHLGYGMSSNGSAYTYWQSLTAMAWLQLLVLFVGGVSHGCGRLGRRIRGHIPLAAPAHLGRMGAADEGDG
jgi:hypothetical protein